MHADARCLLLASRSRESRKISPVCTSTMQWGEQSGPGLCPGGQGGAGGACELQALCPGAVSSTGLRARDVVTPSGTSAVVS